MGICRLGSWVVSQFLLSARVGIVRLIVVISGGGRNSRNIIWKGSGRIIKLNLWIEDNRKKEVSFI